MAKTKRYDAVIVGSGPNGLAAAITIARTGHSVLVLEAESSIGGGCRSAELTLPGFVHDICAAIHPLGVGSPFFRSLPLDRFGLRWAYPQVQIAHPLDDGTAAIVVRSLEKTSASLGPRDGYAYRALFGPLAKNWVALSQDILAPLRFPTHPLLLSRFGVHAVWSARLLSEVKFRQQKARALFAGIAAHAMQPLERTATAAFGLVLTTTAHAIGWPAAVGGSQRIVEAMADYLRSLDGEIRTDVKVRSLDDVPSARVVLCDITPKQLLSIAGQALPAHYKTQLRGFRYGAGVVKVDWALDGPVPWRSADCALAGTVHIGGTLDEISFAERQVARGDVPERPYVLFVQQTQFDPTRAPEGKHTAWAYCHVPNGCTFDMTERIESQVERFAPGFRDRILARHTMLPADMEAHNANYVGGDINGGVQDWRQLYTRPVARRVPYSTPLQGLYICSSSTPPGGGVHGMCGYHAAKAALERDL